MVKCETCGTELRDNILLMGHVRRNHPDKIDETIKKIRETQQWRDPGLGNS